MSLGTKSPGWLNIQASLRPGFTARTHLHLSTGRIPGQSTGFIPLNSPLRPLSGQSTGFFPLISPLRPLYGQSTGFFPLISPLRPLCG
ncbi:DUF1720 domain-containing protein [Paenibacillus ihuae]|uniref:DUF1720 domain-containing protein n=1 Tax=Paenibacillus ihuae TaxID=1232431 RepID=UPI0009E9532F